MDYYVVQNIIFREYNIKSENNIYNIRIEAFEDNISFILKNISTLEYLYKNQIHISSIINELKLPKSKECISNVEFFFKELDYIFKNKQILINIIDEDYLNIVIKKSKDNFKCKIKLKKEYLNNNDKINILYNEINLIKNSIKKPYNDNKFNNYENLIININKKEDDIKNLIN